MNLAEKTSGNPTRNAATTIPAKKKKLKKSKKQKLAEQITRFHNRAQRAKWAVQYPKRVKPTSNGEHLVLSNHTQREGEKLINAIKRKIRHTTKPTAATPDKK
jgi:aminoglycoside phosphotransferase family enzyme